MILADTPPDLDRLREGSFARGDAPREKLRLLSWNIERGLKAREVAGFIRNVNPHVCLLQEVDWNARRTGRRAIAEDFARELGYNYVFATEWIELSQGSRANPAYQGQTTLSRTPIRNARVIRFEEQTEAWRPRWYLMKWGIFQPRLGGRLALRADIEWGGRLLTTYNVHLESRVPEAGRQKQIGEVLRDAARADAVIGGDFNTRLRPSAVIEDTQRAGFRNAIGEDYLNTKRDGSGSQDWIFVRGALRASAGKIHTEIPYSDHFPLTVELVRV